MDYAEVVVAVVVLFVIFLVQLVAVLVQRIFFLEMMFLNFLIGTITLL